MLFVTKHPSGANMFVVLKIPLGFGFKKWRQKPGFRRGKSQESQRPLWSQIPFWLASVFGVQCVILGGGSWELGVGSWELGAGSATEAEPKPPPTDRADRGCQPSDRGGAEDAADRLTEPTEAEPRPPPTDREN